MVYFSVKLFMDKVLSELHGSDILSFVIYINIFEPFIMIIINFSIHPSLEITENSHINVLKIFEAKIYKIKENFIS